MINRTLYRRELLGSGKLLLIFGAILTLYISVIIRMYDPELMKTLDNFVEVLPEIMAAVGMQAGATSLIGFMISYLYGFILLVFPMLVSILRGNGLIAKYVDSGAMVSLAAAPVKRGKIALTQASVLISSLVLLILYATGLELLLARTGFPQETILPQLFRINAGLLCLHLCIGGICFLASCACSETRYSIAFGAGIPTLMYVLQMLANTGEQAEKAKYFTLFTLFDPTGLASGDTGAVLGSLLLLLGAVVFFTAGILIFREKDLHI